MKPAPLPKPAITSMHGFPIAIVALAEDGGAAATADMSGMIRLWPALDGSHEPFVVPGPAPAQLAIARDRDHDFAIAAVDEAGTMTVLVVGDDGRLRKRAQVEDDQLVTEVLATPQGFLALRGDQSIALVTLEGRRWAQLPPGERVAALLYRNHRALALFAGEHSTYRGRWIELASGARWGDPTPELAIELPKHAVLAPDHKHVVAIAKNQLVAVDLATGVASAPFPGKGDPLGYTADGAIACSDESGVVYWSEAGKKLAHVDLGFAPDDSPTAIADGRVATAFGQSLALADQKSASYLGYQIDVPNRVAAAPTGLVLGDDARRWLVDKDFRLARTLSVPHDEYTEVLDAVPITDKITVAIEAVDETRWLTSIGGGHLYVGVRDDAIHFDPGTRLLAEGSTGATTLVRIGEDGSFGKEMVLHTSTSPLAEYLVDTTEEADRVFLLDPALAGGLVAAVVHGHKVFEIHGDDLGPKLKARVTRTFKGALVAIDRAGRLITRAGTGKDLVVTDGEREVVLGGSGDAARVVPSSDGALIAVQGAELSLYALDGTQRWSVPAQGITGLAWQGGTLVGVAQGVVRIDLASGELAERQCGWRFGLYPKPPSGTAERRLVCDA